MIDAQKFAEQHIKKVKPVYWVGFSTGDYFALETGPFATIIQAMGVHPNRQEAVILECKGDNRRPRFVWNADALRWVRLLDKE